MAMATPRITTEDSFYSKPQAFDGAVFLQGFHSILRTSGCEPALRTQQWGNAPLVYLDEEYKRVASYFFQCLHGIVSSTFLQRFSFYPLWKFGRAILSHCTKKIPTAVE